MIDAVARMLLRLTRAVAWLGMALLLAAMFATVADILARKLAGYTYPGTIDVVQLLVLWAAFLAIPYAFMTASHVAVALLVERLTPVWRSAAAALASALSLALVGACGWFALRQALLQMSYGDVSQTVGIPIGWFWTPVVAGFALSLLATGVHFAAALAALARGDAPPRLPGAPDAG